MASGSDSPYHPGQGLPASEALVASATGASFFRALVAHLGRELRVQHVLVAWKTGEDPPEIESVAVWSAGELAPNVRGAMAGSPCELTLQGQATVFPEGVRQRFPACALLARLQAEAYVGVPLVTREGDRLGVLAVLDSQPLADPASVREVLLRFVHRTAAELSRKREEDALRAREELLRSQNETLVALARSRSAGRGDLQSFLHETTEAAARTLGLDRVLVSLFDEGGLEVLRTADLFIVASGRHERGMAIETSACPAYLRALEHERFLDIADAQRDPRINELWESYFVPSGIRSTIDAPIRLGGRLVGVICSEHAGAPRRWQVDETRFVASLADLISLALEAAELTRIQRELSQRNRELSVLHRLSEISLWAHSRSQALQETVDEIARRTGFGRVWIQLLEAGGERLALAAASGLHAADRAQSLAPGESLASEAIARNQTVLRVAQPGERLEGGREAPGGLAVFVGLPLTREGGVLGALCLGSDQPQPLEDGLVALLESLAGEVTSLVVRLRESEQTEALEERLRQAQKLEAIGTLAGGVAHDFNNLLTGILGYTWLLKQSAAPAGEVYKAATVIENAAERAAELTRQLLDFARRGRHEEVPVDLEGLVREVTELLGRTLDKAIAVHLDLRAGHPLVLGDPGQLHQTLLNLAINARDAMPAGGELFFETYLLADARVPRRAHPRLRPGSHLVLTVRDTGHGIPPQQLARIFDPFFTTKEQGQGSGMGLAIVYGIVQAHGGAIEVESQAGHGATFRIYLPLLGEAARLTAAQRAAGRMPEAARGMGLVLVVDDEELVRALAKELLSGLGYEVLTARDGIEALERYRERAADIDLVLLDLVMPRMGGRECLRALRRIDPQVRVLFSSGWPLDEGLQGVQAEGAVGFLPKPYQMAVLAEAVARALQS